MFCNKAKLLHPGTGNYFHCSIPLGQGPPSVALYATRPGGHTGATSRCARSGAHPWPRRWEVTAGRDPQPGTDQWRGLGRGDSGLEEPLFHTETIRHQEIDTFPAARHAALKGAPTIGADPIWGHPDPRKGENWFWGQHTVQAMCRLSKTRSSWTTGDKCQELTQGEEEPATTTKRCADGTQERLAVPRCFSSQNKAFLCPASSKAFLCCLRACN